MYQPKTDKRFVQQSDYQHQYTSFKQKSELGICPRQLYPTRNALYDPVRKGTEKENNLFEHTKKVHENMTKKGLKNVSHLYSTNSIFGDNKLTRDDLEQPKRQLKRTELGERPSHVFNMQPKEGENVEKVFKPSVKKCQIQSSKSYDMDIKKQLKTVDFTQNSTYKRNPITEGDPKSEYNRNLRVQPQNMPRDQFFF